MHLGTFQAIPHSHFATFLSFYSCYSQLGVTVSPYLFMEILNASHLLDNYSVPDALLGGRNSKRKMTGCDLSGVAGVKAVEIDCPTKAWRQAREP